VTKQQLIYCPKCERETADGEWVVVLRRLRQGVPLLRLASVVRHRRCNTKVFVMLD